MERLRTLFSPELWTARGASLLAGILAAAVILVLGRMAAKLAAKMVRRVLDRSRTEPTLVKFLANLVQALILAFVIFATVLIDKNGVKVIVPNSAITSGTIRVHAEVADQRAGAPPQARAG